MPRPRSLTIHLLRLLLSTTIFLSGLTPVLAAPPGQAEEPDDQDQIYLPTIGHSGERSVESAAPSTPQQIGNITPTMRYYHHDPMGKLVARTDPGGTVAWRAAMRAFGQGLATSAEAEMRFLDQPLDKDLGEGGLYQLGARTYDPLIGRFLSPDPLLITSVGRDNPLRFNRYSYALNNPLRYHDGSGFTEFKWDYPKAAEWAIKKLKTPFLDPRLRALLEYSYLKKGDAGWNALYKERWLLRDIRFVETLLRPARPELDRAARVLKRGAKLTGKVTGVLLIFYIFSGSEALASEDYGKAAKTFADATIIGVIADTAEDAGYGTSEEFFELATTWWGDTIYEWLNEEDE